MDGPKATKKRRLADRSLPNSLLTSAAFATDSKMYQDLLEMERKLDWQMTRKRVEIQDALSRPPSMTRTLRLFISHSVANQSWQQAAGAEIPPGDDGTPSWQVKIEGRLLELPNQRAKDRPAARKFSTLIRKMFIELERDPMLYPDGNMAEFHGGPNAGLLDGFTLRRTGDAPVNLKIMLDLRHYPDVYRLTPPLAHVLGMTQDTRPGVLQALWSYIKLQGLQDKLDRRMIRADDALRPVFGADAVPFALLGEICNRHLSPPEPVVLHYTVDPSLPPPERPQAWDIEIRAEDAAAKAKMTAVNVAMTGEGATELAKLDDEISQLAQSLHNSHAKLAFLRSFAADPANFVETWLASQARDLDAVVGTSEAAILGPDSGAPGLTLVDAEAGEGGAGGVPGGRRVRVEELRRSEFFKLPWVEEAVAVQEGIRLATIQRASQGA